MFMGHVYALCPSITCAQTLTFVEQITPGRDSFEQRVFMCSKQQITVCVMGNACRDNRFLDLLFSSAVSSYWERLSGQQILITYNKLYVSDFAAEIPGIATHAVSGIFDAAHIQAVKRDYQLPLDDTKTTFVITLQIDGAEQDGLSENNQEEALRTLLHELMHCYYKIHPMMSN